MKYLLPTVKKFKMFGESGQDEVASILRSFANCSKIFYDLGIDFFCELLDEGHPTGDLFYVQAKTTEKFMECWSEYIEKETVRFWLDQQFPVYVIVCEKSRGAFYWAYVEDNSGAWQSSLLSDDKSVKVVVPRSKVLYRDPNRNSEFKAKIRMDIIRLNAIRGIPAFVKQAHGSYAFGSVPSLRLSDVARENIRGTIRFGFEYLIIDATLRNQFQSAYELGKLLTIFDKGHYEHFLLMGRICRELGKSSEAKAYYETAIEVCKKDLNWDKNLPSNIPTISELVSQIEAEMATLPNEKTLPSK